MVWNLTYFAIVDHTDHLPTLLRRDPEVWNLVKPLDGADSASLTGALLSIPNGQPPSANTDAQVQASGVMNLMQGFKESSQQYRVRSRPQNANLQKAEAAKPTAASIKAEKLAQKIFLEGKCVTFNVLGYSLNHKRQMIAVRHARVFFASVWN